MKNDYDISKQFQDDLIKAYNKVAPFCWTQAEAYKRAVKEPAPRYYISTKQAAQVIAKMVRGNFEKVNVMIPNKRRMYYSLFEKVIELSEKRAFIGKPLYYIMQYAVISPAPEFFTGFESVHKVRTFIKNGNFNDEGRVVKSPARKNAYEKLKRKREVLKSRKRLLSEAPVP